MINVNLTDLERPLPKEWDPDTQLYIKVICQEIQEILLAKNKAYGDSAIHPIRIFSKCDPVEAINVRLDDKISRLMKGHEYANEDTELDLIGYLILKRVARRLYGEQENTHDRSIPTVEGDKQGCCGGSDSVLSDPGRRSCGPSIQERLRTRLGPDVVQEDKEYLPSSQRGVLCPSDSRERYKTIQGLSEDNKGQF